jgi:hypothetical protein
LERPLDPTSPPMDRGVPHPDFPTFSETDLRRKASNVLSIPLSLQ